MTGWRIKRECCSTSKRTGQTLPNLQVPPNQYPRSRVQYLQPPPPSHPIAHSPKDNLDREARESIAALTNGASAAFHFTADVAAAAVIVAKRSMLLCDAEWVLAKMPWTQAFSQMLSLESINIDNFQVPKSISDAQTPIYQMLKSLLASTTGYKKTMFLMTGLSDREWKTLCSTIEKITVFISTGRHIAHSLELMTANPALIQSLIDLVGFFDSKAHCAFITGLLAACVTRKINMSVMRFQENYAFMEDWHMMCTEPGWKGALGSMWASVRDTNWQAPGVTLDPAESCAVTKAHSAALQRIMDNYKPKATGDQYGKKRKWTDQEWSQWEAKKQKKVRPSRPLPSPLQEAPSSETTPRAHDARSSGAPSSRTPPTRTPPIQNLHEPDPIHNYHIQITTPSHNGPSPLLPRSRATPLRPRTTRPPRPPKVAVRARLTAARATPTAARAKASRETTFRRCTPSC